MDQKLLDDLLHRRHEEDWFDFKRKLKLYQTDGKLNDNLQDELIKDILGMANGNSHIIRKTKYLIIGVDDEKFDDNGIRILHNVNYRVPTKNDINGWMKSASEPVVTGIECETLTINDVKLYIISVPPTFDLHETKRDLNTPRRFGEHTVFMRQSDTTVPASVKEGATIQQLKHLHRREIENPSAGWAGVIVGGFVAFLVATPITYSRNSNIDFSSPAVKVFLILFGAFMGAVLGDFTRFILSTWYDWHFITFKGKVFYILYFSIALPALYLLVMWLSKITIR